MSHRGPNWTKDEDNCLIEMTVAGKRSKVIASHLGRTRCAIETRRSTLRQRGVDMTPCAASELKPERPTKAAGRKPRHCMCCEKPFISDGPHNRLCGDCRKKSFGVFDTPVSLAR